MQFLQYRVRKSLRCYVNCIMTDASDDQSGSLALPLYADGYPGIMYQRADNGLFLMPKGKKLSDLFLYGQTLNPVTLSAQGAYQLVVLQLYPFASRYLLNIDPKVLNDECYDLHHLKGISIEEFYERLKTANDLPTQIEIMSDLAEALLSTHTVKQDDRIQSTIHQIIQNRGLGRISEIRDQVYLTERTFERSFMNEVGLTPKQFAKIIQFQSSLEKIENVGSERFTDIAFDCGYADQSHFIRVFKSYTGLSPKQYRLQALQHS
ncbi:helix-turn-helix domain-containing protein [Cesiribacter sp. SM1]|uniref:helix-turn-helix domain-containing protein n=1 Tax=Cesiribacter sp. SM1 TaxID=2861196 RepID=UPI00351CCABF